MQFPAGKSIFPEKKPDFRMEIAFSENEKYDFHAENAFFEKKSPISTRKLHFLKTKCPISIWKLPSNDCLTLKITEKWELMY